MMLINHVSRIKSGVYSDLDGRSRYKAHDCGLRGGKHPRSGYWGVRLKRPSFFQKGKNEFAHID